MIFKQNPILLHFLTTFGTRCITMLFSFGQGIIVARALLPAGRGTIGVYATILGLVFACCGIRQSTAFYLGKRNLPYEKVLRLQRWGFLVLLTILSAMMLGILATKGMLKDWRMALLLEILLAVQIKETMMNGILSARREIPALNVGSLLISGLSFSVMVICYCVYRSSALYFYFVAVILGNAAALLFYRFRIRKLSFPDAPPGTAIEPLRREVGVFLLTGLNFALPLLILDLNYQLNILIISYMDLPMKEVGLYTQAVSMMNLIWFLPRIMAQVIFAYSVSTKNEKAFSLKLWSVMKLIMVCLLPVCIVGGLLTPYLLPLIYGKEFAGAAAPFLIMLPGIYLMIAFKVLNSDFIANGHSMKVSVIFGIALLINLALDWKLIPHWGIRGAATASSVSYIFATIVFVIAYYRALILPARRRTA